MKKPIVLPMDIFNALVANCAEARPEYQTLKNGFVMRNQEGAEEVHIPYDAVSCAELLAFAQGACPEALPYIKAGVSEGEAAAVSQAGRLTSTAGRGMWSVNLKQDHRI